MFGENMDKSELALFYGPGCILKHAKRSNTVLTEQMSTARY